MSTDQVPARRDQGRLLVAQHPEALAAVIAAGLPIHLRDPGRRRQKGVVARGTIAGAELAVRVAVEAMIAMTIEAGLAASVGTETIDERSTSRRHGRIIYGILHRLWGGGHSMKINSRRYISVGGWMTQEYPF